MLLIVVGTVGIVVTALISRSLRAYAVAARRIDPNKPFGGAVPGWVSLLYLVSFACLLYGVYDTFF
jgi:hypothetical protein